MPRQRTAEEISKELNRLMGLTRGLQTVMSKLSTSLEQERGLLEQRSQWTNTIWKSLQDLMKGISNDLASLRASLDDGTTFGIKRADLDDYLFQVAKVFEQCVEPELHLLKPREEMPSTTITRDQMLAFSRTAHNFRRKISASMKG